MPIERTLQLKLMVSEQEMQTVRALAEADGVSVADYVRTCIRAKAREAVESSTTAGHFEATARKFERLGASDVAADFRGVAKELKRLKPPTMAELARMARATERKAKKGKTR
jgi:hypothetical protein